MSAHRPVPCCSLAPRETIARHVHPRAYATLVLEGGYEEAGESGRWQVRAGDVLLHAPFSAHWNHAPMRGARVLNLPLSDVVRHSACGRVDDPDAIARVAANDPREAAHALMQAWRAGEQGLADTPDLLARALSDPDGARVQAWSREQGIARATAFRWFRAAYGVGPTRYRIEARARRAWRTIVDSTADLAEVAAAAGYADQSHMNRDVKAFTGYSPGGWRSRIVRQHSFKTAAG